MEIFDTEIRKDESGRWTIIELPFNAKEIFHIAKGTIFVKGAVNGVEYRSKLRSCGNGRFVMVLDKAMQKAVGFSGDPLPAHVAMTLDDIGTANPANPKRRTAPDCAEHRAAPDCNDRPTELAQDERQPVPACGICGMDVITAIQTRQSIRRFTPQPISEAILDTILNAGFCAPSAKNKRPCSFIVIRDKNVCGQLARDHSNAAMLESAACAIVICGDKNIEGTKEFLYADCAAAAQNMLLCIHGLGLGGVWCGVATNSPWRKQLISLLRLPSKIEPFAVIAVGYPDEKPDMLDHWAPEKIHYESW